MKFRKGDKVVEILRGAGVTTREEGQILYVKKGIAYLDNGPGNDPTEFDAETGEQVGNDYWGWKKTIEKVTE
jgi:hypothetical protein